MCGVRDVDIFVGGTGCPTVHLRGKFVRKNWQIHLDKFSDSSRRIDFSPLDEFPNSSRGRNSFHLDEWGACLLDELLIAFKRNAAEIAANLIVSHQKCVLSPLLPHFRAKTNSPSSDRTLPRTASHPKAVGTRRICVRTRKTAIIQMQICRVNAPTRRAN